MCEIAEQAQAVGVISSDYVRVAKDMLKAMKTVTGKELTINIDASAAAVLCELGMPTKSASGFICLSRGLELLAHAYGEINDGQPTLMWSREEIKRG